MPGHQTVTVKYDKKRNIVFQGQTPNLDKKGELLLNQKMDGTVVDWGSPDATVSNGVPVYNKDTESWSIKEKTTVKKVTDIEGPADHFTRVYGRKTGKRMSDSTHVVRPGFDSNIATDNRLEPNEQERYKIVYNKSDVTAWPVTVEYKAYYLKKGGNGKFPTGSDGFLDNPLPAEQLKKLAIFRGGEPRKDNKIVIPPSCIKYAALYPR